MKQERRKVSLQFTEERELNIPVIYTNEYIIRSSNLLDRFPDSVLLITKHNHPNTCFHFDQLGPCHLLEFDNNGIHSGTHQSIDGRTASYTSYLKGKFILFRKGRFEDTLQPRAIKAEALPPQLLEAYLSTRYIVEGPEIEIRIGHPNPALDKLLEKYSESDWAFITAYNPHSRFLIKDENDNRHEELKKALSTYSCLEGAGIGEDSDWPPERSLLVLGISYENAKEIGNRFGQNAIVTGILGSVPELTVLV